MPCYLQRVKQALMKRVLHLKCRGRSLIRCATISSWTDTLNDEPNTIAGFFMPERRVLREIVCRNSGCKSTEFAQRHGREGIKLMGQKFFDMHESSRLNMSFKCSGAFNIIYIMRIIIAEGEKQPPSVNQYQSYNQRPDLADAMSIPIVNSGT